MSVIHTFHPQQPPLLVQKLVGMSTDVFILNSHDLFVHTDGQKIMVLMLLATFKLFCNQKKCHTRKTKGLKGTCKTCMRRKYAPT